jgi:Rps23 Pro-64 3,4-dihydroxylase Tpa1-like proline 4-hydroxylase
MIPYVLFPNAMGDGFAERLLAFAIDHREAAAPGRVRDLSSPAGRIDSNLRDVLVIANLGSLGAELEAGVDKRLPEVLSRLGVEPFERARTQVNMIAYGDGMFYGKHLDTTLKPRPGQATRRITFVYYFHREPKSFRGGALRLYDVRQRESIDVEPQRDAFIAFPSWMYHEVLPVSCPSLVFADGRFAVNVWVTGRPIVPAA